MLAEPLHLLASHVVALLARTEDLPSLQSGLQLAQWAVDRQHSSMKESIAADWLKKRPAMHTLFRQIAAWHSTAPDAQSKKFTTQVCFAVWVGCLG